MINHIKTKWILMERGVPYFQSNPCLVSGQVSQQPVAAAVPQCHNHPDLGMVFIGGLKLGQFLFPSDGTHPSGLQGVHSRAFISGDGTIGQTAQAS